MDIEASAVANAPVDKVWAILFDEFDDVVRWFSQCKASGALDGAAGERARYVQVRAGRMVERVTDHDAASHRLGYSIRGLPFLVRNASSRWSLDPEGDQTRITLRMSVELLPVLGWLAFPALHFALSGVVKTLVSDLSHHAAAGARG